MARSSDAHRVGQLRNEVSDIYELLGDICGQLDRHESTLADHTATLADHTATLAEHGGKLDRILEILER